MMNSYIGSSFAECNTEVNSVARFCGLVPFFVSHGVAHFCNQQVSPKGIRVSKNNPLGINSLALLLAGGLIMGLLSGCSSDNNSTQTLSNDSALTDTEQQLIGAITARSGGQGLAAFTLPASDDFTAIPQDPANPITAEKIALGQMIFHDTGFALGGRSNDSETWSCATCHHAAAGFKSGIKQGLGEGGVGFGDEGSERVLSTMFNAVADSDAIDLPDIQPVTSPATLNLAYQDVMLWNGQFGHSENGTINSGIDDAILATPGTPKAENNRRLSGIEIQAVAGLGVHRLKVDTDTPLQNNAEYQRLYQAAYPQSDGDVLQDAALAIAAFERTILANEAPFQRWLGGENGSMNEQEVNGALLFFGKADCAACHTGPGLSSQVGATADEVFFAIGMSDYDTSEPTVHGNVAEDVSRGRGGFTGDVSENFKFKVPQLYNLADTSVFGHGAGFDSIRAVVEYKNTGVAQSELPAGQLDTRFRPLGLTDEEIADLTAFLTTALYDPNLMRYEPTTVPSGNCVVADPLQIDGGFRCPQSGAIN